MEITEAAGLPVEALEPIAGALLDAFGHAYPEWTLDDALDELRNRDGLPRTWLAMHEGVGIGCASLLAEDEVDGLAHVGPWLGNVWVHPARRSIGVGRALVDTVAAAARALGCARLHLVTEDAVHWYAAQGWAVDGPVRVHGHPMTAMHRDL